MADDTAVSILNSIYDQALKGVVGSESVQTLANDYLRGSGSLENKVDSLIRYQIAKCSTTGFLTGLGGLLTLPVSIAADVGANLYIQMRMVAAIAYMGGYDVKSDQVRSLVYVALCGNAVNEVIKEVGVQIAGRIAMNTIKNKVSGEVIKKINQAVGFRLITKTGSKGAINLIKAVPLFGGLVSGAFDGYATNAIGEAAKKLFIK